MTNTGSHTGGRIEWPERKTTIEVAHLIGSGGQGEVYAIKHHRELAIKIYHRDRRPEGQLAEKLSTMEVNQPHFSGIPPTRLPRVAWPTKVIKDRSSGHIMGTVMPMVEQASTIPISHVLNPTVRKISLPKHQVTEQEFKQKRRLIVHNIITAVKGIHGVQCLIGDVNDDNILMNPATGEICIVDCDAFQVTDKHNRKIHRCRVGREQFTAPELLTELSRDRCGRRNCVTREESGPHKPNYSCLDRKPEHDMFGIAVIIFKLFMNGAHPYNQKNNTPGNGQSTLKDLISRRQYPYGQRDPGPMVTPVNRTLYQELPDNLKELFLRTFA